MASRQTCVSRASADRAVLRVADTRLMRRMYLRQAIQERLETPTKEKIVAELKEWEAVGMTYAIINFADAAYDSSGIELFAREVMPAFPATHSAAAQ